MRNAMAILAVVLATSRPSPAASRESTASPALYQAWLAKDGNASRVARFEAELKRRKLDGVAPTYQVLRTALEWRRCRAEPFALPPEKTWQGAFDSLTVLRDELVPKVGKVEIVSGYRDTALNACAGGARGSIHRKFGAFDLYPLDSGMTRAKLVPQLCRWHKLRGKALRVGLGIYHGTKFHIDARGHRTWGPDYRRTSSPCEVE